MLQRTRVCCLWAIADKLAIQAVLSTGLHEKLRHYSVNGSTTVGTAVLRWVLQCYGLCCGTEYSTARVTAVPIVNHDSTFWHHMSTSLTQPDFRWWKAFGVTLSLKL